MPAQVADIGTFAPQTRPGIAPTSSACARPDHQVRCWMVGAGRKRQRVVTRVTAEETQLLAAPPPYHLWR